MFVLKNSI